MQTKIQTMTFKGVSFGYESGTKILDEVNFSFPMEEIIFIRATHSGAGRSTVLQILAGLLPIEKGKYFINEAEVSDMSFEKFLKYRLSIGYTFDMGGLLHNKSIFDNLILPLRYHQACTEEEAQERVQYYMKELGIWKYRDQRPSNVQGGVRKLACLIRPVIMHPQVLLLDDPSMGLGQDVVLKYFNLVQRLRVDGIIRHIFISSFDEKLMSIIKHKSIFVESGKIYSEDDLPTTGEVA